MNHPTYQGQGALHKHDMCDDHKSVASFVVLHVTLSIHSPDDHKSVDSFVVLHVTLSIHSPDDHKSVDSFVVLHVTLSIHSPVTLAAMHTPLSEIGQFSTLHAHNKCESSSIIIHLPHQSYALKQPTT
eukprot:TRINITY_DN140782_c0_g1_i1.p1 TRINITY_DN140782_c0_g1~~TRINITY_DN140782_c0_g1_i1.p1  ORF type:complete len:128 (+),score=17.57 TRINITY_DN140782_c0_g1_i1:107-490(+)